MEDVTILVVHILRVGLGQCDGSDEFFEKKAKIYLFGNFTSFSRPSVFPLFPA
ncbi:hypothetical protein OROHE_002171 [Orobanche hederae]